MLRRSVLLILIGILLIPIMAAEDEQNISENYLVREYALISFDEPITTETQGNNTTILQNTNEITENQTRRGGDLSARKLFQLKQGAQSDYRMLRNESGDPSLGLSSTAAQSISILCKQCVPQKSGTYY